MSYHYESERSKLFSEQGVNDFIKVRDNVKSLLKQSGAVRMQEAWKPITGDTWYMMALVDRMVEIGDLREVSSDRERGQDRVFVAKN